MPGPTPYDDERRWLATPDQWSRLYRAVREMRANPTPAEKVLWEQLRRNRLGLHFRRQQCIGPFVVDFYCPKAKLVVEVDGDIHDLLAARDTERTEYLQCRGMHVLRFHNDEVLSGVDRVLAKIAHVMAGRREGGRVMGPPARRLSPSPSPPCREGAKRQASALHRGQDPAFRLPKAHPHGIAPLGHPLGGSPHAQPRRRCHLLCLPCRL